MSRQLPVPRSAIELEVEERSRRAPQRSDDDRTVGRLAPSWLRSPLGSALSDLAPDLVRLAGRLVSRRLQRRDTEVANPSQVEPGSGATGLTLSEVEINLSAPLIRRIVVRSATAWSVAPDLLTSESEPVGSRNRVRKLGIRIAGLAGLATVVLAARRRLSRRA